MRVMVVGVWYQDLAEKAWDDVDGGSYPSPSPRPHLHAGDATGLALPTSDISMDRFAVSQCISANDHHDSNRESSLPTCRESRRLFAPQ